jgi:hypothetical protein
MAKRRLLEPKWQAVLDVPLVPAVARLPSQVLVERRDEATRQELVCRIRGEFHDMPGLSLTLAQAAKLFTLRADIASRILDRLSDARVLRKNRDGQFSLLIEEP